MTQSEWAPHYHSPLDHARECEQRKNPRATCNCYLSWDQENLAHASAFEPATASPPSNQCDEFDEYDRAAFSEFVRHKRWQHDEQQNQSSSAKQLEPYAPLWQGETRVLELYPGEHGELLQGHLHIVNIDFTLSPEWLNGSRPRAPGYAIAVKSEKPLWYTSLSYVWGPPDCTSYIHFERTSVAITSSLATALDQLRSTRESIFLWVDQICINQIDTYEKEHQIPLMGSIYTCATNTVIWLGAEDGQNPSLAFETMEYVYARLQMTSAEITPDDFERLDFPPADDHAWHAVRQLLQRPWLSRLWTIQEAVLSRNLFVRCGDATVNWDDIAAWCYVLQHAKLLQWLSTTDSDYDARRRLPNGGRVINLLQADRTQYLMLNDKENLLSSLVRTRYAQATDPKDKIYGVLAIANSDIVPNYSSSKTARDVYHEACLTQLPTFVYELLSSVDHGTPLRPSWVPDWSTNRVTKAFGYYTKAWTIYHAGWRGTGDSPAATGRRKKMILSLDKERITLRGILFDQIETLGTLMEEATVDIDDPLTNNQTWASNVQLVQDNYRYQDYPVSSCSPYEAFFQTLVAGRDDSGTSPPTEEYSEVFSLILDATTGEMPSLPGQTYSVRRKEGFFTLDSLRYRSPAKTLAELRTAMRSALEMRRFAITKQGYYALVPRGATLRDTIVVFQGACVPFLLRKIDGYEGYELLGEAYVHGIMHGEVMDMWNQKFENITLV